MEEIWKAVNAHPRYQISNLGRLRLNGNVLTPRPNAKNKPYLVYVIAGQRYFIHRLVASAFIRNPNPSQYNQVNHLNGLKQDNRAINLEWCDNRMNQIHAVKMGLHKPFVGEKNFWATITDSKAMAIIRIMATSSLKNREAAKMFGIPYSTMRKIKDGNHWNHLDWYRNKFIHEK